MRVRAANLVLVAFAIGAAVVIKHLASEIECSARNDTLADEVTDLEVCCKQVLEILVLHEKIHTVL